MKYYYCLFALLSEGWEGDSRCHAFLFGKVGNTFFANDYFNAENVTTLNSGYFAPGKTMRINWCFIDRFEACRWHSMAWLLAHKECPAFDKWTSFLISFASKKHKAFRFIHNCHKCLLGAKKKLLLLRIVLFHARPGIHCTKERYTYIVSISAVHFFYGVSRTIITSYHTQNKYHIII